ncbi:DUF7124 domain-containing protein [Halorubrum sp. DTA46]|uniref:DUF7124 domain-containing protein n=1 Tax=Halorubrum sp. DTA46 TaxID=3402162 RepID=UPI003AAD4960
MSLNVDADRAGERSGEVTLVFSLGAARTLADPAGVFADAREWSRYVGVVANEADDVASFLRRHGLENDYALRKWDKWGTLGDIHAEAGTPRHVFVGTTGSDRRLATAIGFEFLTIREAAEKAGWELSDPRGVNADDDRGLLDRLRRAVTDRL